jgi:sugar lactone lactonase YvrE
MLNQPTAIVAVGENDTLYVVDSGNNRLMKYEYGSNIGEQVNISANNNDGTLNKPQDVTIDESDGIYISDAGDIVVDYGNNRLMQYEYGSNISEQVNITADNNK